MVFRYWLTVFVISSVLLSGCTEPAEVSDDQGIADSTEEVVSTPGAVELTGHVVVTLHVGTPCAGDPGGCGFGSRADGQYAVLDIPQANPLKATLVATWDAVAPSAESLFIEFERDPNPNTMGEAYGNGPSPVVVDIPPEAIEAAGAYHVIPSADGPGSVAVKQPVDIVLSLEYA